MKATWPVKPFNSYGYFPDIKPTTSAARKNAEYPSVRTKSESWVRENQISRWLDVPVGNAGFGIGLQILETADVKSVFILVRRTCDDAGQMYLTPGGINKPRKGTPRNRIHSVSHGWDKWHGHYISGKDGLVNGPNTLWFDVQNTGGIDGLRVEVSRHPMLE